MPCVSPVRQLYDSSRPDYTSRLVFFAEPDQVTSVTATNIAPGEEIPLLIRNENHEYVPYVVSGTPVVLTYNDPTVVVDPNNWYKLDVTDITSNPNLTVTSQSRDIEIATSVKAFWLQNSMEPCNFSSWVPVEIVRHSEEEEPVVYLLGTDTRVVSPGEGNFFYDMPQNFKFKTPVYSNLRNFTVGTTPVDIPLNNLHSVLIQNKGAAADGSVVIVNIRPSGTPPSNYGTVEIDPRGSFTTYMDETRNMMATIQATVDNTPIAIVSYDQKVSTICPFNDYTPFNLSEGSPA